MSSVPACILEDIKSKVLSTVKTFAGLAPDALLNVIKRNKSLKSGDFIIYAPSIRSLGSNDIDNNQSERCVIQTQGKANDAGVTSFDDGSIYLDECHIVLNICQVENGIYVTKLARPLLFAEAIEAILKNSACDHGTSLTRVAAVINCAFLNELTQSNSGSDCYSSMTVDQLRLLMVAEHAGRLLQYNGYDVTFVEYPAIEFFNESVYEYFGIDLTFGQKENFSRGCDTKYHGSKILSFASPAEWFSEDLAKISLNISYAASNITETNMDKRQYDVVFDLKKFISDHSSTLKNLPNAADKSLRKVTLSRDSSVVRQLFYLEHKRSRMEHLTNSIKDHKFVDPVICVHVTSYDQELIQQQVATTWQILEPKAASVKQLNILCGNVSSRQGAKPLTYAKDLLSLRQKQMEDAFIMKYGKSNQGHGWRDNMFRLTKAAIKFQLLSTVCRQQVKLDLSVDTSNGGPIDRKGGVFVMYNFARLSTLFSHFEEAVMKGTYPALAELDDIDFSALRQEEEWDLLFNYILVFPSLVRDTVVDFDKPSGSIHIHKICQFLLSLSNSLSILYCKTHILCEPRAHLMPVMFARLYLMKAVQKVMLDGFSILGIEPCLQL